MLRAENAIGVRLAAVILPVPSAVKEPTTVRKPTSLNPLRLKA